MVSVAAPMIESSVQHTTKKAWLVCFAASLFFFYEFIQMNMINTLNQDLMSAFGVHATQLSILSSFYFLANVIFLLPAGQILDRISTRKIILVSMAICVAGTFMFGLSTNLYYAALFRFLTGIGSAFCFLSCIRLASRWFPARRMALVSGLIVTMAMLGGAVAQTPLTLLVEWVGWRHAVRIDAVLGMAIMLIIILFVRDNPEGGKEASDLQQQAVKQMGYWQTLKNSYIRKQNWLCGIYTSLTNLPVFLMGAFAGSLYLQQVHHFTREQSSTVTLMIFFGTVFGSPLAGFISDRLGRRKLPMIIGALLSLFLVLVIIYTPVLNFGMAIVLFFLLGLITSTQVISYPTVAESNSFALTATSVSIVSLCAISGGFFFIPIFGRLMDLTWDHSVVNGVAQYSAHNFYIAMLIMPIAFIIAIVAASQIKETYCQRQTR